MNNVTKKEEFIYVLKFLACLLITNSHCGEFYPISYMEIGGGFGNAIFFAVSGYCLVNIKDDFITWYKKRIRRILPITLSVILVDYIINYHYLEQNLLERNIANYYINKYWFVFAIMLYYIFYYVSFYNKSKKRIIAILIMHFLVYMGLYIGIVDKTMFYVETEGFAWFKVYFYLSIIIAGGLLKLMGNDDRKISKSKEKLYISSLCVIAVISWMIVYVFILLLKKGYVIQCIIQFSVFIFAMTALRLGSLYEDVFKTINIKIKKVIHIIADSTLEIYLVQIFFLEIIKKNGHSGFGSVFWVTALGGGILLHLISSNAKNFCFKKKLKY